MRIEECFLWKKYCRRAQIIVDDLTIKCNLLGGEGTAVVGIIMLQLGSKNWYFICNFQAVILQIQSAAASSDLSTTYVCVCVGVCVCCFVVVVFVVCVGFFVCLCV